ncbi:MULTISPECIES: type II secretion system protein M [Vibrio]|uniref:type II secretion system protein M n=1 Tax=Vibrio TaxID=662 RepID=UPI002075FBDC|nr:MULTISPECIES: type II secretion system protein M [Vibrio]USD32646.1 type II secretion system protein M [Vibrio sp. SCSIO 43186]USD45687.1 type II secretion system protein M [Vibrio sp. SCSIO 43145]USD69771.1 type II secretion system protein M [Vibrio sp. SCSIO 43139]USD94678.1 general secretion pathway protein GspM [Vibrio coralliilyticus]
MKQLMTSLQTWWMGTSQREQRLLIACAILLLLGVIYWGVLQPVSQRAEMATNRIQSERQLLSWVKNKADNISQLRAKGGVASSDLPLNQSISSTAARFGAELVRVQPRGEELQVWIQPMPFNRLVEWMTFLKEKHAVSATFIDIDKAEQEGVVEIKRLQFVKG